MTFVSVLSDMAGLDDEGGQVTRGQDPLDPMVLRKRATLFITNLQ